ncbi:PepSY domain-containing protein [Saccharibacillus sacchari]|uniref:PepSY domain-containing protein n=1 Tax=Saccharibacillus sacchari TaxID=456493 RepID=UPI0004BC8298|nr:PepSY domain-containing protein [Saccharibacillus sacchari]
MKRSSGKLIGSAAVVAVAVTGLILWSPWGAAEPVLTREQAEQELLARYSGQVESANLANGHYDMRLRTEAGLYAVALSASSGQVESIRRLEAAEQTPPEILERTKVKTLLESRATGATVTRLELETPTDADNPFYVAELTDPTGRLLKLTIDAYSGDIRSEQEISAPQTGGNGSAQPPDEPASNPNTGQENPPTENPDSSSNGQNGENPDNSTKPGDKDNQPQKPNHSNDPVRLLSEKEAEKIAAKSLADAGSKVEDTDADLRTEEDGQAYYLVEIELEDGREASVQINAVSGTILSTTWDEDKDADEDAENT